MFTVDSLQQNSAPETWWFQHPTDVQSIRDQTLSVNPEAFCLFQHFGYST